MMKLTFLISLLFLISITTNHAQKMFSFSGGANWGVLENSDNTQYNTNANLAVDMFDSKIRVGLRYSKYGLITDYEKFQFQLGGFFIQFGYRFIDRLRLYIEASFYKGDYGQDIYLYPVIAKNTTYYAGAGGLEYRIYKFIHLTLRLQALNPINHEIMYPKNYSTSIPSVNLGLQFIF